MIIIYVLFLPIIYIIIKSILSILTLKFGKFTYKNFSAVGFEYDSKKNIFTSVKNAWQRNFGYCHLYDVSAPIFRMILDTEIIKFYYNNKNWLITFWKGQYGIVTGAEVGVYCTKDQMIDKNTLYLPASDDEMLIMNIKLYKNGKELSETTSKHWWLSIFKLGMFSRPKDLYAKVKITFPNNEMLNSFLESFKKKRYNSDDYIIIHNTFIFNYKKPKTRKVWTRTWITDFIIQYLNYRNVRLYNKYISDIIEDDSSKSKKINKINDMIPEILKNSSIKYLSYDLEGKNYEQFK